jgi:hypothetical protein
MNKRIIATFFVILGCTAPEILGSTSRQVGPEPGLQFSSPPTGVDLCNYGEYLGPLSSDFSGSCTNFIKAADTMLETYMSGSQSWNYFPLSAAETFNVKLTYNGISGLSAITPTFWQTNPHYVMNLASSSYQNYVANTYVPAFGLVICAIFWSETLLLLLLPIHQGLCCSGHHGNLAISAFKRRAKKS